MSTDPKKLVRTITFTYFLAAVFLMAGYTCKDVKILQISFAFISSLLMISAILALHQNYQKYKIQIFLFLEVCGIIIQSFIIISLFL